MPPTTTVNPVNPVTTVAPATPAVKAEPVVTTLQIGTNTFQCEVGTYGKNSNYAGRHFLKPKFKGASPDAAELMQWVVALGQVPLLTQFGRTLSKVVAEGSVEGFVTGPDGKESCDKAVVIRGIQEVTTSLVRADKSELEAEHEGLLKQLNDGFAKMLELAGQGKLPPEPEQRRLMNIQLDIARVEAKLKPRARKAKSEVVAPAAGVAK